MRGIVNWSGLSKGGSKDEAARCWSAVVGAFAFGCLILRIFRGVEHVLAEGVCGVRVVGLLGGMGVGGRLRLPERGGMLSRCDRGNDVGVVGPLGVSRSRGLPFGPPSLAAMEGRQECRCSGGEGVWHGGDWGDRVRGGRGGGGAADASQRRRYAEGGLATGTVTPLGASRRLAVPGGAIRR